MKTIILSLFAFLSLSLTALAVTVTLPWSTTFTDCIDTNYPEDGWASGSNETVWNNVNVGLKGPVCSKNGFQQISRAANFSDGEGGCGWRRWVCGAQNGTSPSTGTISIRLNNEPEIWLRFHMRWQSGFEWNSSSSHGLYFQKVIYLFTANTGGGLDLWGADNMSFGGNMHGRMYYGKKGCGWNTMNPNGAMQRNGVRLGDGSWHAIELHWKKQSRAEAADGIMQLWIDGVLKMDIRNMVWSTTHDDPGIKLIQFMVNQMTPSNPFPMYNDIDDIALSKTGYIGPYKKNENDHN